jgi:hypothetical protein
MDIESLLAKIAELESELTEANEAFTTVSVALREETLEENDGYNTYRDHNGYVVEIDGEVMWDGLATRDDADAWYAEHYESQ